MKKIVVLLSLVVLVFGQHQHVCLNEEFETDQATYDPQRDDVFVARFFFSLRAQHTRLDVEYAATHDHPWHERVSVLHDYIKGIFYVARFNLENNSATCQVGNLTGKLEPICLSKNAELRGKPLIGGVLHCDNWIERVREHQERVMVDILMVSDINVPIRVLDRRHRDHVSVTEFWNFKESVNHDAWVVPAVCRGEEAVHEDVTLTRKQTLLRVKPNGPLPPF